MFELPEFGWFYRVHEKDTFKNTFSGSAGTSAERGCVSSTTFNYRVFVDVGAEPKELVAQWYLSFPWNSEPPRSETSEKRFECSDDGVKQAEKWLESAYDESHISKQKE